MKKSLVLFFLALSLFSSCGNDDDAPTCNVVDTEANFTLDNQNYEFTKSGYGLNILPSGRHQLDLSFSSINNTSGSNSYLLITTLFRDTGSNVVSYCVFTTYTTNGAITIDFVEGDFTSNVISNNSYCFEVNFSGTIETEAGLLNISNGFASFVYDEPLEDYSFGRENAL